MNEFVSEAYDFVTAHLAAFGVGVGFYVVVTALKFGVGKFFEKRAKKRENTIDDFFSRVLKERTKSWVILVIALYVGTHFTKIPKNINEIIAYVAIVALGIQAGLWGNGAISYIIMWRGQKSEEASGDLSAYGAIRFLSLVAMWSVLGLVVLHNLGVNITALVAGLGVGGIAIALATQNIIGDLFASVSIILDKPFVVGDFIVVDDCMGTVERIGVKTTRLRSLGGEHLVFPNGDLLGSRIRNYTRMYERRVVYTFGIVYETPHEKIEAVPSHVRGIIESLDKTRFDRAHFKEYGDFSLIYEVVYYVLSPDYNLYMDIQQAILLEMNKIFAREGIEFAYPTRVVYSKQERSMDIDVKAKGKG